MINSILMIQQPAVSVLIIGTTKRFYTRGTLRGMRISRFAKIPTLYHDWREPWIKKMVNYLSCIEGKGGLKDIHYIAQIVDLL